MKESSFFTFVEYLNAQVVNTSELAIAKVIVANVDKIMMLSLEQIASQANISSASVSRFVKKLGFDSFAGFKLALYIQLNDIAKLRENQNQRQFGQTGIAGLSLRMYQNSQNNLQSTYASLDQQKLGAIATSLKNANTVTFLGDYHALASFYLVQLDLLAHKIPCYSFYNREYAHQGIAMLTSADVIVYFSVAANFNNPQDHLMLQKARNQKAKIICFCQDEPESGQIDFDILYPYGKARSINDGYYSLFLLANIISNLIYLEEGD